MRIMRLNMNPMKSVLSIMTILLLCSSNISSMLFVAQPTTTTIRTTDKLSSASEERLVMPTSGRAFKFSLDNPFGSSGTSKKSNASPPAVEEAQLGSKVGIADSSSSMKSYGGNNESIGKKGLTINNNDEDTFGLNSSSSSSVNVNTSGSSEPDPTPVKKNSNNRGEARIIKGLGLGFGKIGRK